MAKINFTTVDDYLEMQPWPARGVLETVRSVIRKALPRAEEAISYQMPAYKLPEGTVIYFAGWKKHYSLYPASGGLVEAFKEELAPYEVSKGTIRFPLSLPVPVTLIEQIVKFRTKEVAAGGRAAGLRQKP